MGDIFYTLVCRAMQYDNFKAFCKDWFVFSVEYMKTAWNIAKGVE